METQSVLQAPLSVEQRIVEVLRQGASLVVVTLVASSGSTPRHAGTRALLTKDGFEGTVGGGILEAKTKDLAETCLADAVSRRETFVLDSSSPTADMVCGGQIDVVCEVVHPASIEHFVRAEEALNHGLRGYWLLRLTNGVERRLVLETDNDSLAWANVTALAQKTHGKPGLVLENSEIIYVEPIVAQPVLLLCGGGHVSLEVARLAVTCGFVVDVCDDRREFANPTRFPMARQCAVVPEFRDMFSTCWLGPASYVAIMTRGHAYDQEVLEQVLQHKVFYVGMIGSRTKRAHVYEALRAKGISMETLAKVCCPIGLGIKAETPQQIAVAVVAELLAAKGGVLSTLRPKHD